MGTIGSLSLMRDFLDDPFILINGDLFTEPPYKRMLKSYEAKGASMVVDKSMITSHLMEL